jgi:hypothetical protein
VSSQTDLFRPPDPPRNSSQTHSPSSTASQSSYRICHHSEADDVSTDSAPLPRVVTARRQSLSSESDASKPSQRHRDFTKGSDFDEDPDPAVCPSLTFGRPTPSPSPAHPSDASSLSPSSPIRSTKSDFSQRHPIHSVAFSTTPTSSDALLGNQQHQVLESWGELFSNLNDPRQHAPAPLPLASDIPPNGGHKRYRQQRITPVGHDRNAPYGDTVQAKRVGLSRFYFISFNGISYHRNLLDFCEILQSFIDNDIDVYGLSEINLDALRKQLEDISQDFFGTSVVATSTSNLRSRTPHKPGGTLTGISNELCGRHKTSGSDQHGLGQWSCIQLCAKGGRSLIIITACRVCEGNVSTSGASAAFHQQWNIL